MIDRTAYERFRVSPVDPATIRIAHVEELLSRLADRSSGRLRVEKFAESYEGWPIFLATLGSGPRRVLLWSQMHGDEPTHTAVLLDLMSYLLRSSTEPFAEEILAGCTLCMIPLLNPDGAERSSRFNAQDIDVNRDARRRATPEGRALRKAVETLKPEFAFNLHNQNARTAAGKPPKVVVASLLAPPPDEQRTETDAVRRAKQIAARFINTTRADVDHVDGRLAKYDDTYEPRAFGDWVQSTGAATVLVEAGGWPAADAEPLVRLHFHGMLSSLHAIATESYRDVDPAIYESLPFSNSANLLDCLITGGQVIDVDRGAKFIADIAINYAQGNRLTRVKHSDGKITEVGDLSVWGARETINAANCVVLPGRVVFLEDWNLSKPLEAERLDSLLSAGVTTIIGMVHPTNRDEIEDTASTEAMPVNWGFVVRLYSPRAFSSGLIERLAFAVSRGAIAIVGNEFTPAGRATLEWLKVPLLEIEKLPKSWDSVGADRELAQQIWKAHKLLDLDVRRGRIGRDFVGDLQILEAEPADDRPTLLKWDRLKRVLVAGTSVWEGGKRTGSNAGVFLRGH